MHYKLDELIDFVLSKSQCKFFISKVFYKVLISNRNNIYKLENRSRVILKSKIPI